MNLSDRFRDEESAQHRMQAANDIINDIKEWISSDTTSAKKRWIWELVQNALDTCKETERQFEIEILFDKARKSLIFRHNAGKFTITNLSALITGTSSKRSKSDIGKFGSGFLVTHILSKNVSIKGNANLDGHITSFTLELERESTQLETMLQHIADCQEKLIKDLEKSKKPDKWDAEYKYDITNNLGINAIDIGLHQLELLMPFVFCFNNKLKSVKVNDKVYSSENVSQPDNFDKYGNMRILKMQVNDDSQPRFVLVVNDNSTGIAFEITLDDSDRLKFLEIPSGIPRLFICVPLIGTEDLGIPFVINDENLVPVKKRDAVLLTIRTESSNSNGDDAANNSDIVNKAFVLYNNSLNSFSSTTDNDMVNILAFTSADHSIVDVAKHFNSVASSTIKEIYNSTPCIQCGSTYKKAIDCIFPLPQIKKYEHDARSLNLTNDFELHFSQFYDLISKIATWPKSIPNQRDAIKLHKIMRLWDKICSPDLYDGSVLITVDKDFITLNDLKSKISNCRYETENKYLWPYLKDLQKILSVDIDPKLYLNQLFIFIDTLLSEKIITDTGFADGLLLNQDDQICRRTYVYDTATKQTFNIFIDNDIPKEIKDLVDRLSEEVTMADCLLHDDFKQYKIVEALQLNTMSTNDAIDEILRWKPPAGNYKEDFDKDEINAWIELFVFCSLNDKQQYLKKLPIFLKSNFIKNYDNSIRFLAPFRMLNISAAYEEIYPNGYILAEDYFSNEETNKTLLDILISENIIYPDLFEYLPIYELKASEVLHFNSFAISLDKFAECDHSMTGSFYQMRYLSPHIIGKIGQDNVMCTKFLSFIEEIACNKTPQWNDYMDCQCTCGQPHKMYPALWLAHLKSHKWVAVPAGNEGGKAEASIANEENLRKLLGEKGIQEFIGKQWSVELLSHFGFSSLSLSVNSYAQKSSFTEAAIVSTLTHLLRPDIDLFTAVTDLIQITNPKNIVKIKQAIKIMADDQKRENLNKTAGEYIEQLLRNILQHEYGLTVDKKDYGFDLEAWPRDNLGVDTPYYMEVKGTLIEVKLLISGTQARMSSYQGQTAAETLQPYYLCVIDFNGLGISIENICTHDSPDDLLMNSIRDRAHFVDLKGSFGKYFDSEKDIQVDIKGFWIGKGLWIEGISIDNWAKLIK